jgi:hypothetical protein
LARLIATEIIPVRHQAANMAFSKTSMYSYNPASVTGPYYRGLGQNLRLPVHPTPEHNIIFTYKGSVINTLLIMCAMLCPLLKIQ